MRGRKPKPTTLKILAGQRADQINLNEPRFAQGSLVAPAWLTGVALDHWNELAPIVSSAGLLTEGDRAALARLCDDFAISRSGGKRADLAKSRYIRLLQEFGLTPSSRSRIKSTQGPPKDKLDEYFARKPGKREA